MADSSLYIAISMLIASFNITKAQDEDGNDIVPEYVYKSGIARYASVEFINNR